MKVLQVNKFLYPVGGAEMVMFRTADLLRRHGHSVSFFGMRDERNIVDADPDQLVESVDLHPSSNSLLSTRHWLTAGRMIHSREAAARIERAIEAFRPDVAHLHNIYHQLSPSILGPLKKHRIPIVLTLHDYKLICPNYLLYSGSGVCERCLGHRYYNAVLQGCVKGSRLKSALCATEAYVHRATDAYRDVDVFAAPSRFLQAKVLEFGVDASRVVHLPNFLDFDAYEQSTGVQTYFVYAGRLETVKGVHTLLDAVKDSELAQGFELRIAGDGEQRKELEERCAREGMSNVRFLGRLSPEAVGELIRNAMFLVLPSEWYENAPVSVLEAYAYGKPVIGSAIGGITEMIEQGRTGYLYQPGNAAELREKIEILLSAPERAGEMTPSVNEFAERHFGAEAHYRRLMDVYALATGHRLGTQSVSAGVT